MEVDIYTIRNVPSFLGTNKIGAPYGDFEGLMYPLTRSSVTCALATVSSLGLSRKGRRIGGIAPATSGIVWPTSKCPISRLGGGSDRTSLYSSSRAANCGAGIRPGSGTGVRVYVIEGLVDLFS